MKNKKLIYSIVVVVLIIVVSIIVRAIRNNDQGNSEIISDLESDSSTITESSDTDSNLDLNAIPPSENIKMKVFFSNDNLDPEISCTKVFPSERTVASTLAVGRASLLELLAGPTEAEKAAGFQTNINKDVTLQSLTLENGIMKADFNDQLEYQVGGSCRISAIRAQITETLKQFPTVQDVVISINGRTEDILQP